MRLANPILTVVLSLAALAGCSDPPEAAAPSASPSPVVTPDQWAVQTCEYLGKQDPGNEFANDIAVTMAQQSTLPEVVELAAKAKQAGSSNLLRAWCQRHVPSSGATPAGPAPS